MDKSSLELGHADSTAVPNFLIIGAPKAATTFLHDSLSQHPEVFLTLKKETRFFAFEGKEIDPNDPVNRKVVTTFEEYLAAFRNSEDYKARGEASPVYFGAPAVPQKIHKRFPSMKFIAIVRQPVERAYSHYMFARQKGFEPIDATFRDALSTPTIRFKGFLRERPYLVDSMYGKSYRQYLEFFDKTQFLFLRYEDLRNDKLETLRRVERFLNISNFPGYDFSNRLAASGEPTSRILYDLAGSRVLRVAMRSIMSRRAANVAQSKMKALFLRKKQISIDDWEWAMSYFSNDILEFEELSDLDLSAWQHPVDFLNYD